VRGKGQRLRLMPAAETRKLKHAPPRACGHRKDPYTVGLAGAGAKLAPHQAQ